MTQAEQQLSRIEQLAQASEAGKLSEFFGFTPAHLAELERLARAMVTSGDLNAGTTIAKGVLALDPKRADMEQLMEEIEKLTVQRQAETDKIARA